MKSTFLVVAIIFAIAVLIKLNNLWVNTALILAYISFWVWVFKTAKVVPPDADI